MAGVTTPTHVRLFTLAGFAPGCRHRCCGVADRNQNTRITNSSELVVIARVPHARNAPVYDLYIYVIATPAAFIVASWQVFSLWPSHQCEIGRWKPLAAINLLTGPLLCAFTNDSAQQQHCKY